MPATPFDSIHLSALFDAGETAKLFTDSAEIRAMMLVEGALAEVQGAAGVIPETAAAAIRRASLECQVDPVSLAKSVGQNGVSVPGLVAAFREAMQAPEHAQFLHWGATSQDIQDTGLMLRLRQALVQAEARLDTILSRLATLAETHAETPMAARTYGQHATPTGFGAVVAGWGWPLLKARGSLAALRADCLLVSLSGAAGTGSALGPDPAALRSALAERLGLADPGRSWHADRTPVLRIADWLSRVTLALGKMGEDLVLATQSGIAEVRLGGAGASSTMPQKQNPVVPSLLVALARHAQGLNATLQGAAIHRQQRDGAAWFTEWLTLPQLVLTASAALERTAELVEGLEPEAEAMRAALDETGGLILAEALSFALAEQMPRPKAQAEAKTLCQAARAEGRPLSDLARAAFPDLPVSLFDWSAQLGQASAEARAFARAVRG
ncbi:class-II fumarase/aspartase family protein [Thetidibacter halocola]|uniref:Adenylosuccinate lyase family protein n=1 Tax=Thetidibacter halocola TaxID=2827239 RepID=A0A8J7WCT9_9RHOB|nr:adenylosuccinate lyase family protein [Thetidibacter halocola]MBS0125225.1 adenylosuccinate lyase family protein [Thetidibacter halocola]